MQQWVNSRDIFWFLLFSEPQEPDNDDQPVGGAVLAGLQVEVGPGRVRRGEAAPRAQWPHLETWYRALQQVRRQTVLLLPSAQWRY